MLFYRYNRIIFSWSQETNLDYKIKTWQRIKLKTVLTTTTTTKKFKRCIDFFCLLVYNILLFNFETNKKKKLVEVVLRQILYFLLSTLLHLFINFI